MRAGLCIACCEKTPFGCGFAAGLQSRSVSRRLEAAATSFTAARLRSRVLVFAPAQSDKRVGNFIASFLKWPHWVLVHDSQGENWALTAGTQNRWTLTNAKASANCERQTRDRELF
jgi:hypothetical protein